MYSLSSVISSYDIDFQMTLREKKTYRFVKNWFDFRHIKITSLSFFCEKLRDLFVENLDTHLSQSRLHVTP